MALKVNYKGTSAIVNDENEVTGEKILVDNINFFLLDIKENEKIMDHKEALMHELLFRFPGIEFEAV